MKRKIITLGTILLLHSVVQAQYIPNIIPPSPNASSIAKFVESPVSYYTGSANVGVPLFTINTRDIPLDVSIQYDTKGVRVAEIASSIGAGWSLKAGGLITRQVRHRPDEYNLGYLTYSYNAEFETNTALRHQLGDENAAYGTSDTPVDEDPDLYFINFLGKSAKFIIDNVTKKAVVQSFDDWKIDIDYENPTAGNYRISRIVITDEAGNQYSFGQDFSKANPAYDIVTASSSGLITGPLSDHENGYKTAWHLKEVKTQKGNCLFNYTTEQVTTFSKTDLSSTISQTVNGNTISIQNPISLGMTVTSQQMLQNISFHEGILEFTYDTVEREDLKGGRALQNIILKDKNGSQIKKMALVQTYRQGDGNHTNINSIVLSKDLRSDKRLFLNQINELDRNNNIVSSYKFEYNPKELPNRFSNAIDYWGYFNGKPNKENIFMDNSNRDVDASFAEAGILTKIIFPTGGSESFYYEDHNGVVPKYFSDFMLASPSKPYDIKATAIAKGPEYFVLNSNSTSLGKYIKEFTIQNTYDYQIFYTANLGQNCTDKETSECKTKVRLYHIPTGTAYTITQGQQTLLNPPVDNGNYRIEVTNGSFTLSDSQNYETNPFSVSLQWKEKKETLPINSFVGGGRRIARIDTNENGKITKRNFTYTLDSGTTSGLLLGVPDYMYIIKRFGNYPLVAGNKSDSVEPMSSFNNGGQVGYSQVTETFLSANDVVLWSKKYNFTNYKDGGEYYKYPYHLPDNMDWARGLNLKTVSYDSEGKTVEKIENLYNFSGEEFTPYRFYRKYDGTVASNTPQNDLMPMPPNQAPPSYIVSHEIKSIPIYKWGRYQDANSTPAFDNDTYRTAFFYGGMIRNYKKIKTEYVNGSPSLITTIETVNGSLNHHQVTSRKTNMSDGNTIDILYQYAHEQNNTDMIAANMVGIPLLTEGKENGKTISKTQTVYGKNATTNNMILPVAAQKFDKDNTASARNTVDYNQYDAKGNLLQFTTKGNAPTAIIWGYNGTLPIARIEGATYQEVQSLAADIIARSNADIDTATEKALMTALDTFRNQAALKNYSITTYTYDPLIGVTSVTPSTGVREFYLYDGAGRLQSVVDANNNILKEMKYNYKP
ncbi:hypothetical protein [Chryseobacterium flavum]|uniref:hypothetical protein n=1 Tax=Chryseobacterium flavum TaxID=415851 RepID=UPI002FDB4570